jgi:hypothetical protein
VKRKTPRAAETASGAGERGSIRVAGWLPPDPAERIPVAPHKIHFFELLENAFTQEVSHG